MCSDVTPDARRLITAMRIAMIPTPSGIVNQSDIVCSLLRSRQNPHGEKGQGMGPGQPGRPEGVLPHVCWELCEFLSGRRQQASAGDCATARSRFIGEQVV